MASAAALSVDDILADLAALGALSTPWDGADAQRAQSQGFHRPEQQHALLSLGHSLLPEKLRDAHQTADKGRGTGHSRARLADPLISSSLAPPPGKDQEGPEQVEALLVELGADNSGVAAGTNARRREDAAFQLSQLYIASAQRVLELNSNTAARGHGARSSQGASATGRRDMGALLDAEAAATGNGRFEALHRRVAQMHASTETDLRELVEVQRLTSAAHT